MATKVLEKNATTAAGRSVIAKVLWCFKDFTPVLPNQHSNAYEVLSQQQQNSIPMMVVFQKKNKC